MLDSSKILTSSSSNSCTLEYISPTSGINTAPYVVSINSWSNPNLGITIITNSTYTGCTLALSGNAVYPECMQIKLDVSAGQSQTVTIPSLGTDISACTLTFGSPPTLSWAGMTTAPIPFTGGAIDATTNFTTTVFIMDPSGNPVSTDTSNYFAKGTLTGIVTAARDDTGSIVREEADNGTRIKFELPAGKSLLAGTILRIDAATTDTSTDTSTAQTATITLQPNATGATSFYLRFYNTQGINNAFIDINSTSYLLTPAIISDVINYYSKLTVYAYRATFAAAITTDYDYKFADNAIPEPALTGSLEITTSTVSTTTLTGKVSTSLPGRTDKFPKYMKLLLKARNETTAKTIIYNQR
jgi:hypothetical protein